MRRQEVVIPHDIDKQSTRNQSVLCNYNWVKWFLKEHSFFKVEKILKGSPDSISTPSPSVKIQIIGRKVCLRCKGKTLLAYWTLSTNFENKKFVDITQQCFAFLPRVNFPANNLNFHWRWRWWDLIQAIFLNLFYFTYMLQKFLTLVNITCTNACAALEGAATAATAAVVAAAKFIYRRRGVLADGGGSLAFVLFHHSQSHIRLMLPSMFLSSLTTTQATEHN